MSRVYGKFIRPPSFIMQRKADGFLLCTDKVWREPAVALSPWHLISFYVSRKQALAKHGDTVIAHAIDGSLNKYVKENIIGKPVQQPCLSK